MDIIRVNGGRKLNGEITLTSAKNAMLPIVACCIACDGQVVLKNSAPFSDVLDMLKIIDFLGGKTAFVGNEIVISTSGANFKEIPVNLTGSIRSSVFILGPLLSRFNKAVVSYPGGCEIGLRPIDLHIYALRRLGVVITEENGFIRCDGSNMHAGEINFDFPSVGATENAIMSSVFLDGETVIRNCAREPEIVDLCNFINTMGGKIYGAGNDTIVVKGVKRLRGGEYTPITDRIIGGTYLCACAVCGGDIEVKNLQSHLLSSVVEKLRTTGCVISVKDNSIRLRSNGKLSAVHKIETQPFPGFPTDMQAQFVATLSIAKGCSLMVENLFESRFKYTAQLNKMGAKITVKDRIAVIKGVKELRGAPVDAEDLRGGASLVIASLVAKGETTIGGVRHIDRGYYRIEDDLSALGADIIRENR